MSRFTQKTHATKDNAGAVLAFISILSILAGFISIFPILLGGTKGVFYSFEPDIVYVSNAILHNYTGIVRYIDHPGTVAIRIISLFLYPVRIYTKVFTNTDFISWTIQNQSVFYLYTRLLQALIFSSGMFFYLVAIYRVSRSYLTTMFAWLGLYAFRELSVFLGATIAPETTTFLVLSLWFFAFSFYLEKPIRFWMYSLTILAGVALAGKFTSFFYFPMLILIVLSQKPRFYKSNILTVIALCSLYLSAFIAATWPIRHQYLGMVGWLVRLATHSSIHGGGDNTFFSFEKYTLSLSSLINLEFWAVIFILFGVAIIGINFFSRKKSANLSVIIVFFISLLGSFIFAKYPLAHYQLPNYFALVFSTSYFYSKITLPIKLGLLAVLMCILPTNIDWFLSTTGREISLITKLETHLMMVPADATIVWEWSRAKDYTILHSRDWIGHIYAEKLVAIRPNMYGLDFANLSLLIAPDGSRIPLDSVCWDRLYIQQASVPILIQKNPELGLLPSKLLTGTTNNMVEIISSKCSVNNTSGQPY